jgi:DNA repair protein RecO (recombination protein O)
MMRQLRDRHDDQPAFVLHAYAYRETSLIVEALSASHGRVALVARGAKRPRSELRGVLQAFQPLTLSWAGGGELKTLIRAEWRSGLPLVSAGAVVRLLPEQLFASCCRAKTQPSS